MKRIQAQRKFAQGAPIPSNNFSNTERRLDITPNKEEYRNIVHNNTPAKTFLDFVSFNQIHEHRVPVVVLERLRTNPSNPFIINQKIGELEGSLESRVSSSSNYSSDAMCLRSHMNIDNKSEDKKEENDSANDESLIPECSTVETQKEKSKSETPTKNKDKKTINNTAESGSKSSQKDCVYPIIKYINCNISDVSVDEDMPLAHYAVKKKRLCDNKTKRLTPNRKSKNKVLRKSQLPSKILQKPNSIPSDCTKKTRNAIENLSIFAKSPVVVCDYIPEMKVNEDMPSTAKYQCDMINLSQAKVSTSMRDKSNVSKNSTVMRVMRKGNLKNRQNLTNKAFIKKATAKKNTRQASKNALRNKETNGPRLRDRNKDSLLVAKRPTKKKIGETNCLLLKKLASRMTRSLTPRRSPRPSLSPTRSLNMAVSHQSETDVRDESHEVWKDDCPTDVDFMNKDVMCMKLCTNTNIVRKKPIFSCALRPKSSENPVSGSKPQQQSVKKHLIDSFNIHSTSGESMTNRKDISQKKIQRPEYRIQNSNSIPSPNIRVLIEQQDYGNARFFSTQQINETQFQPSTSATAECPRCRTTDENVNNTTPTPINDMNENARRSVLLAPIFTPTAAEFSDPVAYFNSIMPTAQKFGICKVVPPADFIPSCYVNEEMVFNVTNQYIARLFSRWGPGAREMATIKAHLASQSVVFKRAPLYEGMEVNLPKLYQIVQRHGGLKKVIERKRWSRVAEEMRFTKRPNPEKKLDQLYVKYLLPYDTLSSAERAEIMSNVERIWSDKYRKMMERALNPLHRQTKLLNGFDSSEDEDYEEDEYITGALAEAEECVVPGRKMNLATFKKVATTALDTFFSSPLYPTPTEVEKEYWRLVLHGTDHVCVNSASIDTGGAGYGFTKNKQDKYGDHPWNLKMLANNTGNILRFLGPVLGVTVPTLHLGMVFSTSCWHRDPHGLPWMEFMHSGPPKIWYGIPDEQSQQFRNAVESLCPTSCQNKSIWLPSDIAMIPPELLLEHNLSLSRVEQRPGEYIIVFPKAYSCSISTGFTVSESVYFASTSWLKNGLTCFLEAQVSCEPTMISVESLLIEMVRKTPGPRDAHMPALVTLSVMLFGELHYRHVLETKCFAYRKAIKYLKHQPGAWNVREQDECEVCRKTLFLSRVRGLTKNNTSLCLQHAITILEMWKTKKIVVPFFELDYYFTDEDFTRILYEGCNNLSDDTT